MEPSHSPAVRESASKAPSSSSEGTLSNPKRSKEAPDKHPRSLSDSEKALMSADTVKAGAKRALHVQPAWSGSCAIRGLRSIKQLRCS